MTECIFCFSHHHQANDKILKSGGIGSIRKTVKDQIKRGKSVWVFKKKFSSSANTLLFLQHSFQHYVSKCGWIRKIKRKFTKQAKIKEEKEKKMTK